MISRKKTIPTWRWPALIALSIHLLLSTLMSCADELGSHEENGIPVQFLPELRPNNLTEEDQEAATYSPQGNLGGAPRSLGAPPRGRSRAANDSWDKDDEVGIYMTPHSTGAIDVANALKENRCYKATQSGTSTTLVPVTASIFFPSNGSQVNFMAYYPYHSAVHSTHGHVYPVNVGTQAPLAAIDLLYHSSTTPYDMNDAGNSVPLVFNHQLSKLSISVVPASGVSADLSTATAKLVGVPTTAGFNLSTGVLSNAAGTTTTLAPVKNATLSSAGVAVFESIFVPHGASATDRVITLNIGGQDYSYTLAKDREFEAGVAYGYSFKFTGSEIVMTQRTVVDWDGGVILWGERQLTTTKTYFDVAHTASTGLSVILSTTSPVTPQIVLSNESGSVTVDKPTWITDAAFSAAVTTDDWITRTLTFNVTANDKTESRTGYIHLLIEGLTVVIRVTQEAGEWQAPVNVNDGLANCYIVKPGTSVQIPATRAFTIGGAKASNSLAMKVLWDDNTVVTGIPTLSAKTESGVITVTTASGKPGNAVVALYDVSSNTIHWSWHIWAIDYDPGAATWTNNGYTFMDRYLGATEAALSLAGRGLLYQWGRKDPFPGGKAGMAGYAALNKFTGLSGVANPITGVNTAAEGITKSIQNPTFFYTTYNETHWDWLPTQENSLWNTNANKKTVYDPCPSGWRVPVRKDGTNSAAVDSNSPWYNLPSMAWTMADDAGVNWGVNALYPADGYRSNKDGTYREGGEGIYPWCASVNGTFAYFLTFFRRGTLLLSRYEYRSYGLPVRCVQE